MKKNYFLSLFGVLFLVFAAATSYSQSKHRLVVKVSDERKEPVEGASVKIEFKTNAYTDWKNETADWEGFVYRNYVGAGTFIIMVSAPGFNTATRTIVVDAKDPSGDIPVFLTLERKKGLKLVVVNVFEKGSMMPLYNAQISLRGSVHRYNGATNNVGEAVIPVEHGDNYSVTVTHAGYEPARGNIAIKQFNDGTTEHSLAFELIPTNEEKPKPLNVYVMDKNRKPIQGATVLVLPGRSAVSNERGFAQAAHKQQPGEYIDVTVQANGYKDGHKRVLVGTNQGTGITRAADAVTFVLEKGGNVRDVFTIVIEVLDDQNNQPVKGASVKLELSDGTSQAGSTDSKGLVKFTDMEYGYQGVSAKVKVSHKEYKEKWSDIAEELMKAADMDERNFLVSLSKKDDGNCKSSDAEAFSKLVGSWKGYRMHVTLGGSCSNVTGTWKVTEWCEGVDETYNSSVARVQGTITGKMENGSLQLKIKAPPSPNNAKGTDVTGSCYLRSDGSLSCTFGCPGELKRQ